MASGDADSEAVVQKALEDFLKEHGGGESLRCVLNELLQPALEQ